MNNNLTTFTSYD